MKLAPGAQRPRFPGVPGGAAVRVSRHGIYIVRSSWCQAALPRSSGGAVGRCPHTTEMRCASQDEPRKSEGPKATCCRLVELQWLFLKVARVPCTLHAGGAVSGASCSAVGLRLDLFGWKLERCWQWHGESAARSLRRTLPRPALKLALMNHLRCLWPNPLNHCVHGQ